MTERSPHDVTVVLTRVGAGERVLREAVRTLALQRLIALYEKWGKPATASEYRRRMSEPKI